MSDCLPFGRQFFERDSQNDEKIFELNSSYSSIQSPLILGKCSEISTQDYKQQQDSEFTIQPKENYEKTFQQFQNSELETIQQQYYSEKAFQDLKKKIKKNPLMSLRNNIKSLANNFVKYCEANKQLLELEPIKNFIQKRNSEKQKSGNIKQFQKLSKDLQIYDKELIPNFIRNENLLYLIHSNRIENPFDHIQTINSFYASSLKPERMIGNDQIEKDHYQE